MTEGISGFRFSIYEAPALSFLWIDEPRGGANQRTSEDVIGSVLQRLLLRGTAKGFGKRRDHGVESAK
jgi:hypothetical protein